MARNSPRPGSLYQNNGKTRFTPGFRAFPPGFSGTLTGRRWQRCQSTSSPRAGVGMVLSGSTLVDPGNTRTLPFDNSPEASKCTSFGSCKHYRKPKWQISTFYPDAHCRFDITRKACQNPQAVDLAPVQLAEFTHHVKPDRPGVPRSPLDLQSPGIRMGVIARHLSPGFALWNW